MRKWHLACVGKLPNSPLTLTHCFAPFAKGWDNVPRPSSNHLRVDLA